MTTYIRKPKRPNSPPKQRLLDALSELNVLPSSRGEVQVFIGPGQQINSIKTVNVVDV